VLSRMISLEQGDVYIAPEQKLMGSAVEYEEEVLAICEVVIGQGVVEVAWGTV